MTKKAIVHFCIEFIPTFGFFVAAQVTGFFQATAVLMGLSVISFLVGWLTERKLPTLPIIITLFVVVSGTITLVYQNPDALILSNSIYFFGFSLALMAGLAMRFNILKRIFKETFAMSDRGWNILAVRWAGILGLVGIGNEIIRLNYSPEIWVTYKFVTTIFMTTFAVSQLALSRKYRLPDYSNQFGIRTKDE